MSRQVPISSVMTTEVVTFAPTDQVADAMERLVAAGIDGAPVVDEDGRVVGMLSTGDLIVQDAELHIPTVISLFGASIELPASKRHFEEDLRKALGATVGDVMAWSDLIYEATGVRPTHLKVLSTVMAHLQQCDNVRGALVSVSPPRATVAMVQEAFLALANITVEVYTQPAGMSGNVIDPKKVVLYTSNAAVAATLYGIPVEATEDAYRALSVQPGIVAGAWRQPDPSVPWTKATGLALPILASPDSTLCAQVIA